METQKKSAENCCAGGANFKDKRKKIIVIFVIGVIMLAVLFVATVAAKAKLHEKNTAVTASNQGSSASVAMYPSPYSPYDDARQFILPPDASRSGEILMQVASADDVAKDIAAVASANAGAVYATYSSSLQKNSLKNGFIVVQVDENKFDATYASLKLLGIKILQESTKKIPRYDYAIPMPAGGAMKKNIDVQENSLPASEPDSGVAVDQPLIAPVPASIYLANKGYIKVNFIEGSRVTAGMQKNSGAVSALMSYEGRGLRKNILVVLAVKSIAVIALIFIIIILTIRLVRHTRLRRANKKKPVVHIVRQQTKARSRVIKTAKRK